ncbi:xanthine dehydrogenase accessory protein XdhC [Acidihalobacter ferrooxydans]|uniref:Xanthine dehydrogenase accessory protein XdhC n=1 Tax=Acidihalobacter ferrooxydans TaxID=1765967 RepID=A0A1P8UHG6_9GAMM|nr:xanthine dehydrogenase accessory protein XdhC [Acidihalobacter ferrooxydans]APZ43272.1 xanthine dehydrogenase accessory protein XdhC [Acidihalobacter ferrooxydans]
MNNPARQFVAQPVAEALIVRVRGSAPVAVGNSMRLLRDGRWDGTVGGGHLEHALRDSLRTLAGDTAAPRRFDFTLGAGSDQCCGGRVEACALPIPPLFGALYAPGAARVYTVNGTALSLAGGTTADGRWRGAPAARAALAGVNEAGYSPDGHWFVLPATPRTPLWLFGAGHVARALARCAAELDFAIDVFDARDEWADPTAFPDDIRLHREIEPAALAQPPRTAVILVMTHSHTLDYALLEHFLPQPLAYLGVIGSRSKATRFYHALQRDGHSLPPQLHMPIGLPGLGKRPAEIAISVLAELLALRQRDAGQTAPTHRPTQGLS